VGEHRHADQDSAKHMTLAVPRSSVALRHAVSRAADGLPTGCARGCQAINRAGHAASQRMRAIGKIAILCLAAAFLSAGAARAEAGAPVLPAPNFAHFNHLISTAVMGGEPVDVLNIYSQAPDFEFVAAPGEGYACVDDAARGIVLLSAALDRHDDAVKQHQLELLTKFVLAMQNPNGYFNNFIQSDGTINTSYKTSVAELNWWSLRALWGLESAYRHLPTDSDLARQVAASQARLVHNLERDLPVGPHRSGPAGKRAFPDWLPSGSGSDQAAVAIIGLLPYYGRTHDAQALALIGSLADGIMAMQAGDARHFPFGMHLSWRNTWHAWGSDQAYALLLAGQQLQRPAYIASGLGEVDHFYPYLLDHGLPSELSVSRAGAAYTALRTGRFPQIAYGIRPMVYAAEEAWRLTGKRRYHRLARRFAEWLTGNNPAHRAVYDAASGRVADGIVTHARINPNSGAESTIEGLLALQRLTQDKLR
jgi:hypothetical protein